MHGIKLSLRWALVLVLGCWGTAQSTNSEQTLDQLRVVELMRQETEKLLQPHPSKSPGPSAQTPDETPHLRAIYGVGQRLLAEVHWQGQDYLYLKGQAWPLGHTQNQLRLVKLAGRCITLAHQEQTHHVCIKNPGGQ